DYASSTWWLRELLQICNCIRTSSRHVLPIFYDVHPSEVRKQSGYFEKAFVQHKERFREDKEKMEEVQRWRKALADVADICGWDFQKKSQPEVIEEIVERIKNIIGPKFVRLPNDNLVGMQSRVEALIKLLRLDLVDEVRVVGISGMPGIGKSTVARALYEKISYRYDYTCFIDDVSQIYRHSGKYGVQRQLLSPSPKENNLEICNHADGTCLVWKRLLKARALVIFDNVDEMEQLQIFTGNRDHMLRECLGGGSRIIVISRDEQILKTHGVHDSNHYIVEMLYELLCKNAFRGIETIARDYENVMRDVLSYAEGHPLAIQVLGSSMHSKSVSQWKCRLAKLREHKNTKIMDVLRLGFNELDHTNKEIFLDIACFFNHYEVQKVTEILDFRGFHPECGLQDLIDKSLITQLGSIIYMHHLLMDLGRCIVKEKSPNQPSNWSRLWKYEDLHKIMSNKMAAENLEAIVLEDNVSRNIERTMTADIISKMSHLKLFVVYSMNNFGSLDYLSNELGYLNWSHYPFERLPPSFQPDKLIELSLEHSLVKQLWKGTKPLHNLKRLNLFCSESLIKMPDLGEAINLECINLEGCIKLKQIHSSVGLLRKLTILNLKNCTSLIKLPYFNQDLNLEMLYLEGCRQLEEINPSIGLLRKLTFLNLKDCKSVVSLPNSILGLNSLKYLNLSGCSKLFNIQLLGKGRDGDSDSCLLPSLSTFPCMRELDLSFCNLVQIPDAIGNLSCLEILKLSGNNFATLPNLKECSKLYYLNLQDCKQLKYLPQLPSPTVWTSKVYSLPSTEFVFGDFWSLRMPRSPFSGVILNMFNCPKIVDRDRSTSMTISWMIQIGSEIPRWFNNQHVGIHSLSSPVMPDHGCLAVLVACVVTNMSDHMWLVYLNPFEFADWLNHWQWRINSMAEAEFGIEFEDKVKVKKYGYRFIYKQDLELSNLTMMHRQNSLPRKRKFLAIEENTFAPSHSSFSIPMSSNAIILSTASSSSYLYDVFVSFRGEDTRNNFTAFLFDALHKNGIDAFKDDADLKKGESIAPELLQAIQASRIFIVVFSKDYASSTWCLRELLQICNCIGTSARHVLPIFYDVDPSEVRKQSGYFEKAFAEHEERFREDKEKMEEVQIWRHALTQVANISGWDIQNESQPAMIQQIVEKIKNIIGPKFLSLPNDNLVGMQSRVEELEELLCLDSVNEVRVVGISGMSGIGKSTVARALYEKISYRYDYTCFIDDVSQIYRHSGKYGVQRQLLSPSPKENNLEICNLADGTCLVWKRLLKARALVIFDNVDEMEQLQIFTGNRDHMLRECLGGGSRIIVISRDEQILKTHGVHDVYQVQPLYRLDAYELLCKNAFRGIEIITKDYEEVMDDVLSYAHGHPLAIQVLGSSMHSKSVSQWESTLAKLREHNNKDIMKVLRVGFDELEDTNKEIFLDIACFFNHYEVQKVTEILDFRGFHPECGLQDLVDKSLITIKENQIYMHNLLRDLGRCIVKEKSPNEPNNWSRLWEYEDLHKIMSNNMAAENLEAIVLHDIGSRNFEITMKADIISKMSHLKLLVIYCFNLIRSLDYIDDLGNLSHERGYHSHLSYELGYLSHESGYLSHESGYLSHELGYLSHESGYLSHELGYLSNELGYLCWPHYPYKSLPQSFQPDKLIELSLRYSRVKQLWKGTKPLHNLKRLNLSYSQSLIKMPDLGEAINLECIYFHGCTRIKEIHPSVGFLKKLTLVSLKDCTSLIKLLHFQEAFYLERLILEGCIQLQKINPSIGLLRKLIFLNLKNCKSLVSLPNSILGLNSLEYLNISGCSKLQLLEVRDGEAPIRSHTTLSIIKWWLYSRVHKDSVSCLLPSSSTFPCVRQLDLSFCNLVQIPDAIGNLSCLEELNLSRNNFATLPDLKECSKLYYLNLQDCKQLKYLAQLPSRTVFPSNVYTQPLFTTEFVFPANWPFKKTRRPRFREVALNMLNCPKIVDRERTTRMTISWMIQIGEVSDMNNSSIIPGSEIPWWFNNQHVGIDSFSCPFMPDCGCLGVLICVVVGTRDGKEIVSAMYPPKSRKRYDGIEIPAVLAENLVMDISDHMLLVYFSQKSLPTRGCSSFLRQTINKMIGKAFHVKVE
ncbi:TMV resistance protein N, partial [Mucuna pruriens]